MLPELIFQKRLKIQFKVKYPNSQVLATNLKKKKIFFKDQVLIYLTNQQKGDKEETSIA